ncbi:MAG: alpha/beta hydrolase-fold protein [Gemmataceae bacterium]
MPRLMAFSAPGFAARLAVALLALGFASRLTAAEPAGFTLTADPQALDAPFTGRVVVLLTKSKPNPLPKSLNWFNPEPAFAQDVTGWKPGTPLAVGAGGRAITPLAKVPPGKWWATAVIDRDLGGISFAASPGNVYSTPKQVELPAADPVRLTLDQVYREPPLKDTDTVKFVTVESRLLTKFHGRPTVMTAGVILPPSFGKEPGRKYPVVYEIPGFGGDATAARFMAGAKPGVLADGVEAIWVVLDANCRLGHHVFADSANNGPVGQALVEELIPYIEGKFRGDGRPGKRLVTGHSSGGWSSLWLQVTYPEVFGGCWSTSPDPVDFRDFQKVDIYDPGVSLFTDSGGNPRPLSRPSGGRRLMFKSFSDMERVMGRGGQLGSFEAVFSPKGPDGKPLELWDRDTGAINPKVAKAWEKYDIRLVLERSWPTLGPKLAGKLHVWMGEEDTFLLEGATKKLKKSLADLGSDAVIELFPGKTHALVDGKLRQRMKAEMAAALKKE